MQKNNVSRIVITLVALAAFWAADKASWQVRTLHESGMDWMGAASHFLDDITNNPIHFSFHKKDLLTALIALGLLALALFYSHTQFIS